MLTIYGDLISDETVKIYGVGFDEYLYMLKAKGKKHDVHLISLMQYIQLS